MRYPTPGSLVQATWEPSSNTGYHLGYAVVLATSRHKKVVSVNAATEILNERIERVVYWRSVRKVDRDELSPELIDAEWAEDASGSAWVKVAYPVVGAES